MSIGGASRVSTSEERKQGFLRTMAAATLILTILLCLGMTAFAENTVRLPAALRELGESAFQGDTSLDTVVVPEGVSEIPAYAFADSSLKDIYLPESVETIADTAFDNTDVVLHVRSQPAYDWAVTNQMDVALESALELTSAATEGVMLNLRFRVTTGTDAIENGYGVTLLLSNNRDDFSSPVARRNLMGGNQLKINSEKSFNLKLVPNMSVWGRIIMTPQGPGPWFASSEPFQIQTGNVTYDTVTLDEQWSAALTSGTNLQFRADTAGLYTITGSGMTGLYVQNGYGNDIAGQNGEEYLYGVYLQANETIYFGVDQNSGTEKQCELLIQQVTDTELKGLETASLGENTITRSQPMKFTATTSGVHHISISGANFQRLDGNRWIDCYSSADLVLEAGQSVWVQMFYGNGNSPMTATLTITGPTAPEGSSLELTSATTEGVMLQVGFKLTTGTDALQNGYGVTLLLSDNRDDFSAPLAHRSIMNGNQLRISSEESSTLKMAPNMNVWGRLIMTPQGPGEWFASSEPFQIETGNVSYESVTLDREWTAELASGTDLQFQAETAGLYAITGNGMTGLYVRNGYGSDVAGQSGENYFYGVYLRANETVYFGVDQNSGTEKECELLVQQVTDTDLKGLGTASLGENTLTRSQPLKFTATSGGTHRFSVNGASFQRLEENRWIDCYSSANLELEAGQSIWVQMFYGDGNSPMTATLTITLS